MTYEAFVMTASLRVSGMVTRERERIQTRERMDLVLLCLQIQGGTFLRIDSNFDTAHMRMD